MSSKFIQKANFNAAGASPGGQIGQDHDPECHLILIVLQVALRQQDSISIYANDWPTANSTCVQDYIHINNLVDTHLRDLDRLEFGRGIKVNLGIGNRYGVRQIIDACRQVTGHQISTKIGPHRAGDLAALVADANQAFKQLGWEPKYKAPKAIIGTAWSWH